MSEVLMVFTGRPPEQLLAEGGTQSWSLNARRARNCEYVICVQNRHTFEKFHPTEPHDTAFMIGKITEVALSEEQPDASEKKPERYIVKFKEYARVAVHVDRVGNRNPVSYVKLDDLGIDPDKLEFVTGPDEKPEALQEAYMDGLPLTMAQAKQGLALTFGVPPEAVEITIRG